MKNATEQQINATFTEWMRRYQEEHDRYTAERRALSAFRGDPRTYGDEATPYFLLILTEIQKSA